MKYTKLFFLFLLFSVMVSCTKEDTISNVDSIEPQNLITNQRSSDNRLEFSSFDELNSFILDIQESDTELLDEAYRMSQEEEYNSLLYIYDLDNEELETNGISVGEIATVSSEDDMLLLLLNQAGEIAIGDNIYKINGEFVYIYTPDYVYLIDEFLDSYNSATIEIQNDDIFRYEEELIVYKHNNDNLLEEETRSQLGYVSIGNDIRMKAKQYDDYWLFYSSVGVYTKVQKRKSTFFGLFKKWKTKKATNAVNYDINWTKYDIDPGMAQMLTSHPQPLSFISQIPSINTSTGAENCFCDSAGKRFDKSTGFIVDRFTIVRGRSGHASAVPDVNPNAVYTLLETN